MDDKQMAQVYTIVTGTEKVRRRDQNMNWKSLGNKGGHRGSCSPGMLAGIMSNNDESHWMIPQLFWNARSILQ